MTGVATPNIIPKIVQTSLTGSGTSIFTKKTPPPLSLQKALTLLLIESLVDKFVEFGRDYNFLAYKFR